MRRTDHTTAELVRNEIMTRTALLRKLIDPKRDIDKECGYPSALTIDDYRTIYDREGIGTRVVDIFPEESWKTDPEVLEKADGEFTPWEQQWKDLEEEFNLYHEMLRADCISGIGTFGILLIGIDDGKALSEPADGVEEVENVLPDMGDTEKAKKQGTPEKPTRRLIYVRPFDESVVKIKQYETDTTKPRYGQPTLYTITMADDSVQVKSQGVSAPDSKAMDVHWTRVIHLADNRKNSLVFGVPRLQDVFNRTYDLRKLCGGSGEMFWKGGFPGLSFEMPPGAMGIAAMTEDDKKGLRKEIENYMNGLQRYLALANMQTKSLAPQVADPTAHFEMFIKAICISKGIPYRIFMGSEEAQLAGDQDKKEWNDRLKRRQQKYIAPRILRPFLRRLMNMGVLTRLEKIIITWQDLNSPSDKDKAENGLKRTQAMAAYVSGQVDTLCPPLEYFTHVLSYDTETAEAILEQANLDQDGTLATREDDQMEQDAQTQETDHQLQKDALKQKGQAAAKKPKPTRNSFWAE